MFRVECFIDDKHLAKLKWALHEIGAYNVSDQPVADSKPKAKVRGTSADEMPALFLDWAKRNRLQEIRAPQMRDFCTGLGMSERSYSHVLGILRRAKVVTKHGKGSSSIFWKISARAAK